MSTAADLLANINKARAQVREAEREEADARKVLRTAAEKLRTAQKRYSAAIDEALDENRQPGLFDMAEPAPAVPVPQPPAIVAEAEPEVPTWCKLALKETGWHEEWDEKVWAAISPVCFTAGELARRLLNGETFGLTQLQLEEVYGAVEMISENDEHPIQFGNEEADCENPAPPVVKGEPIEPLGLTAAELDKAVCPGKIGRAGDKPKALPVVTLNGHPHLVVAAMYPPGFGGRPTEWWVRPIWTEKEFPNRYAGELSESVQRSDIYLGVKVLVGKGKAATVHIVGPKHEERKLIEFADVREPKPTPAPIQQKPTAAVVDPPPPGDETEAWLRRANDGAKGTGQDPKRLKRQITEYRDDQAANNAHPMWNHWSEFFVLLLNDGKDTGDRVRVLSKPDWDGEKGRHHIEFWHSRISETGYWSIVTPKVGAMLVEWCREHIQKQADEYQAGRRAKPTPPPSEQKAVTRLSEIPNIPDAVLDLFLVKGISTLPALLERVEGLGANAELPLRNRVVAYLVNQMVKLKPAEQAADAVAAHIEAGDKPPAKIVGVLNLPKPKRVRKSKAVAQ